MPKTLSDLIMQQSMGKGGAYGVSSSNNIKPKMKPFLEKNKKTKFFIPMNKLNDINKKIDYKQRYEDELYKKLYQETLPKAPSSLRDIPQYNPVQLEQFTSATGKKGFSPIINPTTGMFASSRINLGDSIPQQRYRPPPPRPQRRYPKFVESVQIESLPPSIRSGSTRYIREGSQSSRGTRVSRQPSLLSLLDRPQSEYSGSVEDLGYAEEHYDSPEPSEYGTSGVFDVAGRRGRDFRGQFGSIASSRRSSRQSGSEYGSDIGSDFSYATVEGLNPLSFSQQARLSATPLTDVEVFGLSGQDIFGRNPMYSSAIDYEEQ
jgi:hypothetical protein